MSETEPDADAVLYTVTVTQNGRYQVKLYNGSTFNVGSAHNAHKLARDMIAEMERLATENFPLGPKPRTIDLAIAKAVEKIHAMTRAPGKRPTHAGRKSDDTHVLVVAATGKPSKSNRSPVQALVNANSGQFFFVRRDDGRFNIQFPDGHVEIVTREELRDGFADVPESKGGDDLRAVRDWLAPS